MEIFKINKQEELEQFKSENGNYEINGHLELNCSINILKSLIVEGYLSIEAGYHIKAGGSIEAGSYIKAGSYVFSFIFKIKCKYIITTILPFHRNYYAQIPVLKKFKKEILDENQCWNSLRKLTKSEANKILKWNGWHPIIKVQLKMFWGLVDRVDGSEL